jgi:hypothetical protein
MARYAFSAPIQPGKMDAWKRYTAEMKGPRKAELVASRKKAGLKQEHVWLQHTPMGDFAVVYWEADDAGKVFQYFMTSNDAFDKWFRDKVLVETHGMSPSTPPPPLNERILDYSV